jgi:uncharacterized RDD family membrane protein YckC
MHCLRCGAKLAEDEVGCSKCGFLEDIGNMKSKKVEPKSTKGVSDKSIYAGFWWRGIALILDLLILIGGEALLAAIIGGLILLMSAISGHHVDLHIIHSFAVGFGVVFAFALNWVYFTWFESSKYQATLGKKIIGLIVADLDGQIISLGGANIRYWSKAISALILFGGFWMMVFSKKKRTLHDLIAGTVVLKQEGRALSKIKLKLKSKPKPELELKPESEEELNKA